LDLDLRITFERQEMTILNIDVADREKNVPLAVLSR
jgi:hypothetical protein